MTRTVLAFIVSPLPAPALYYLSAVFVQGSGGDLAPANFGMVYLLGLPLAYLAVLAIGMPLHFLSTRLQWRSIAWFLSGGALGGVFVGLVIPMLAGLEYHVLTLACFAVVGAVSGAVFFVFVKTPVAQPA